MKKKMLFLHDALRVDVLVTEAWMNKHPSRYGNPKNHAHRSRVTKEVRELFIHESVRLRALLQKIDPAFKIEIKRGV